MNWLDVVHKAIIEHRPVILGTIDGARHAGRPLHIGPRSVWMVIGNSDLFVPLTEIDYVQDVHQNPEGA